MRESNQIFTTEQVGEKLREKEQRTYVGFINLQRTYDWVISEALWQVLRTYNVGDKLLNGISMYLIV